MALQGGFASDYSSCKGRKKFLDDYTSGKQNPRPSGTRVENKWQAMAGEKSDLYYSLFPAYHLSKAWGLLPVRFVKLTPNRYYGRLCYPDIIYSVCLLLSFICVQIWGLWRDLRDGWEFSTRMKSQTGVAVTCTDILAVITLATVSVLGAPFRWYKIQNVMDRLVDVDAKLSRLVAVRKSRRFSTFLILGSLLFLIVVSVLDVQVWSHHARATKRKYDKGSLNYVAVYFLYVIVVMLEIQYALAANSLSQRFNKLNESLEIILHRERIFDCFRNEFGIGDFSEHGRFRATIKGESGSGKLFRRRKISASSVIKNEGDNSAETIAQLVAVHSSLSDSVLLINAAFGVPVLVAILTCLLHLIVTPYFLIIEVNGIHNELFLFVQFLWCLAHVSRLLIIVQPCYSVSTEVKRTAVLVSQLLSTSWEPDVRKQLKVFSLQLLHRPLEFSACGLCSLDRSLVTSITGAVTTYLVILIQFQKADETNDASIILKNASSLHTH